MESRNPAHKIVPITFRVGPLSVNLIKTSPHSLAQRLLSYAVLDPAKLAININHHSH